MVKKKEVEDKELTPSKRKLTVDDLRAGFYVYVEETAQGKAEMTYVNLFPQEKPKEAIESRIKEYRRLREKFAPVAAGIDYLKDQILGSGIDVGIDDLKNDNHKEIRDWVREFVNNVYQDDIVCSFIEILDMMLDEALTVGASASEICYKEDINFADYVQSSEEITVGAEKQLVYIMREPKWEDDKNLVSITRLKIISDAITRVKPHKHPASWEIQFWTLDEKTDKPIITGGVAIPNKKLDTKVIMYNPWEIFWLAINKGSVIEQVYDVAILLEKIEKAVGEGIYRAGNKKYFIICGTEKRPWGEPHIRNFMKLLKEMSEKGWGSIPVPAGFDIKEIGGEVFEGRDIVDHFVGMLAWGMGIPKDAIEMARGRATESATDIASNKINRKRNALARAIQHQLFARHVWCKYGKSKQKQGGKSEEKTWIPPVKWLQKGFVSIKSRIEMLYKGLNVANPLRPEVVLEANREISELLGWEVILPTQEEYQKILEKIAAQLEEKKQGQPKPQTEERQENRLEGMQEKSKGKGKSKEMGGPRTPAEEKPIQETYMVGGQKLTLTEIKELRIQLDIQKRREEIKSQLAIQSAEEARKLAEEKRKEILEEEGE